MSPAERALRTQADATPGCYTHVVVEVAAVREVLDELDQARAQVAMSEQERGVT